MHLTSALRILLITIFLSLGQVMADPVIEQTVESPKQSEKAEEPGAAEQKAKHEGFAQYPYQGAFGGFAGYGGYPGMYIPYQPYQYAAPFPAPGQAYGYGVGVKFPEGILKLVMKRLFWLWTLILAARVFALFEWVHPDEWQPEENGDRSVTEQATEFIMEKSGSIKDTSKEMAHKAGEKMKDIGSSVWEESKELGNEFKEGVKDLRRRSREDLYEPMVRMMKHALNVFEEEDRFMEEPLAASMKKGWPSRFETNAKLWREYPDEYLLFVDVPGIPRSDLTCNITCNHVIISGRHGTCIRPVKSAEGEDRFCLERSIFESVRLPEDVHAEKLECNFKDGVLIVKMPKMAVEGKKVPVKEYVPSWSERAKEAKEAIMEKVGMHKHP